MQTLEHIAPARHATKRGLDPGKANAADLAGSGSAILEKVAKRAKRGVLTVGDNRGLLMVNLTPVDISDSAGAQAIVDAIRKRWPWVKHLFADGAYDRSWTRPPIWTS